LAKAPDPWFLRSAAPRILLNCSRQSGKSTVTALLAAHTALYQPGALVLLLSPTLAADGGLLAGERDDPRAVGQLEPQSALVLDRDGGFEVAVARRG
jgi:hypothetical protein